MLDISRMTDNDRRILEQSRGKQGMTDRIALVWGVAGLQTLIAIIRLCGDGNDQSDCEYLHNAICHLHQMRSYASN